MMILFLPRKHLWIFVASLLIFIVTLRVEAVPYKKMQQNSILDEALDLFYKQHYIAASHLFDSYINKHADSPYITLAAYHNALCSLKLVGISGESILLQFLEKYPFSIYDPLIHYALAQLYEKKQAYNQSIDHYLTAYQNTRRKSLQQMTYYRLAYVYLCAKQFDKSLNCFKTVSQQAEQLAASSNYYIAYIYLLQKDYGNARTYLQKAAVDEKYALLIPYLIMETYCMEKNFKQALSYIQAVEKKHPTGLQNQSDITLLKAEANFFLKNYTLAAKEYEKYVQNYPAEATYAIKYRLAYSYYENKDKRKALKYFKEIALSAKGKYAQLAGYYMGHIYVQMGQKQQALAAFHEAKKNQFSLAISADAAFQYAQLNDELGNLTVAINAFQQFKKDYPHHAYSHIVDNFLSKIYLRVNHYDLAIQHIEALADKSPDDLQVYQKATFYKGNACFNQEQYDQAIQWFSKSLLYQLDKQIALEANLWIAESYAAKQKYAEAIPHYQVVFKLLAEGAQCLSPCQHVFYGLAYAYFNTEQYSKALPLFCKYTNEVESLKQDAEYWYQDAQIRLADCYYAIKDYTKAMALYDMLAPIYPAHTHYQKALTYIALNDIKSAQQQLEIIIKQYRGSLYDEKALFEYANLTLKNQDYTRAVEAFTDFIVNKPFSPLIPDALLNRAVAQVNLKQNEAAIKDYETILKEYPNHANVQAALLELPKIMTKEEQSRKMQVYLANYKAANPESASLENISFNAAKNLFYSQNYCQAIEKFNAFISDYPHSEHIDEARFLLAEAYYRSGEDERALTYYYIANKNTKSPFYNKGLLRIAQISYKNKVYKNALFNYQQLKERAANKKEAYYALEGIMMVSDALQQYEAVKQAANQIIDQGNITVNAINKAEMYLGKIAMKQNEKAAALVHFEKIATSGDDVYAAEAQYLIAQIYYQIGDYKKSLECLFVLNQNFSTYTAWTNQGFLLMADNYLALQELFQARATLESIIENANDSTIVKMAEKKIKPILDKEMTDSVAQAKILQKKQGKSALQAIDNK